MRNFSIRLLAAAATLCAVGAAVHTTDVLASPPPDTWILAAADQLTGRSLTLSCAGSARSWAIDLARAGLPAAEGDEYYGFSVIDAGELHLSPYVCTGLRLGLVTSTRKANELEVAWAVDVLLHESVHLGRRTADESVAEACARVELPGALHRLFGIAFRSVELARLTSAAELFRATMGAPYQGGVCRTSAA